MWHHILSIAHERGAESWQTLKMLNEKSVQLGSCETTVNVLGSFMHRQDWCTNLICNHQFVPRNYKVYCTSMSISNQTWPHSIIDRDLCTSQSVRCTSAHAGTKRNNRTLRSSEQLFCFKLSGCHRFKRQPREWLSQYTSSAHLINANAEMASRIRPRRLLSTIYYNIIVLIIRRSII
jgi:hypothetical protein